MVLLCILCALFLTRLGDLANYHGHQSLWLTVLTKLFRLYAFEHQCCHHYLPASAFHGTLGHRCNPAVI